MDDGQDPDLLANDLEHDAMVADAQLPVTAKRARERRAVSRRIGGESRLDRSRYPRPGRRRDALEVLVLHPRVISEGVGHSACLGSARSPDGGVRQSGTPVHGPVPLLGDAGQAEIFVSLDRVAQEVTCLGRQRGALPARKTPERVVQGTLKDHVDARVLRRHARSVSEVTHCTGDNDRVILSVAAAVTARVNVRGRPSAASA